MRFQNLLIHGEHRLGVEAARGVVLLPPVVEGRSMTKMEAAIAAWAEEGASFQARVAQLADKGEAVPEGTVGYRPAVERPGKIFCIGLNYRRHAEETGQAIPTVPVVFGVFQNALAAHGDAIPIPPAAHQVDYEAELTIVMGRPCFQVSPAEALRYVFGYTIGNDVSARDLQNATSQWLIGKTLDGFCPVGPTVVTTDEIPDPNRLAIALRLNGETRQQSNTVDMIFSCAELVAYLSSLMVLEPGDLILTGTPEGVILGRSEAERRWIQPGDRVEVEIEGLGTLTNTFQVHPGTLPLKPSA